MQTSKIINYGFNKKSCLPCGRAAFHKLFRYLNYTEFGTNLLEGIDDVVEVLCFM